MIGIEARLKIVPTCGVLLKIYTFLYLVSMLLPGFTYLAVRRLHQQRFVHTYI